VFQETPNIHNISKRILCAFIAQYVPKTYEHSCYNTETLDGTPIAYFNSNELISFKESEQTRSASRDKKYCLTFDEFLKLDRNPYTNNKFTIEFLKNIILQNKQKKKYPWDETIKIRYNSTDEISVYRKLKIDLSRKIADDNFQKIERTPKPAIIKKYKQFYPNIKQDYDILSRISILSNLYLFLIQYNYQYATLESHNQQTQTRPIINILQAQFANTMNDQPTWGNRETSDLNQSDLNQSNPFNFPITSII